MVFLLDTDHVSLALRGNKQLQQRIEQSRLPVFTSTITVQELFNGWVLRINNAALSDDFVDLYAQLDNTVEYLRKTEILSFDQGADNCFRVLLLNNPSLRKNRLQRDMRIAAIALSQDATVITRNRRDFEQVPNLKIEDWTI